MSVLDDLRSSFRAGRLEYLVGAGASISAGLPDWNELNRRLLGEFLARKYSQLEFEDRDLEVAAAAFVEQFGREAVVDHVRDEGRRRFPSSLRKALYPRVAFYPTSYHFELVAALNSAQRLRLARPQRLISFNFDNLLEQAGKILGSRLEAVWDGSGRKPPYGHVVHPHGFVPPSGTLHRGKLVLSERDYLEADADWAQSVLRPLFRKSGVDLLLVGLSIADPRLRKLLLQRMESFTPAGRQNRIFAILPESHAPANSEFIERVTHRLLRENVRHFWRSWQLEVVYIKGYDEVPFLLRQIRLGSNGTDWLKRGRDALKALAPTFYSSVRLDGWQLVAVQALKNSVEFIRRRFAVPRDEEVHVGAFVPSARGSTIELAFRYTGREDARKDVVLTAEAARRRLNVADLTKPQGAAGRCFLTGAPFEAQIGMGLDLNFSREMSRDWNSERTFSSVLCVPIFDGPEWVPMGVAFVTSNSVTPFWSNVGNRKPDYLALQGLLRSLFDAVVRYTY